MEVSDIIALGSLLVAIIALIKSFLSDRKVKTIDLLLKKRELNKASLEDDENHKADVEVNVVETAKGSNNKLRFYNKGKAAAEGARQKVGICHSAGGQGEIWVFHGKSGDKVDPKVGGGHGDGNVLRAVVQTFLNFSAGIVYAA